MQFAEPTGGRLRSVAFLCDLQQALYVICQEGKGFCQVEMRFISSWLV